MYYLIIDDNQKYIDKLIELFQSKDWQFEKITISQTNKYWLSNIYKKLYEFRKSKKEICLVINSELKVNSNKRSETEGLSIVLNVFSSAILEFKGKIILYGFLPSTSLNKKISLTSIAQIFYKDRLFYYKLPISNSSWSKYLFNENKKGLFKDK